MGGNSDTSEDTVLLLNATLQENALALTAELGVSLHIDAPLRALLPSLAVVASFNGSTLGNAAIAPLTLGKGWNALTVAASVPASAVQSNAALVHSLANNEDVSILISGSAEDLECPIQRLLAYVSMEVPLGGVDLNAWLNDLLAGESETDASLARRAGSVSQGNLHIASDSAGDDPDGEESTSIGVQFHDLRAFSATAESAVLRGEVFLSHMPFGLAGALPSLDAEVGFECSAAQKARAARSADSSATDDFAVLLEDACASAADGLVRVGTLHLDAGVVASYDVAGLGTPRGFFAQGADYTAHCAPGALTFTVSELAILRAFLFDAASADSSVAATAMLFARTSSAGGTCLLSRILSTVTIEVAAEALLDGVSGGTEGGGGSGGAAFGLALTTTLQFEDEDVAVQVAVVSAHASTAPSTGRRGCEEV